MEGGDREGLADRRFGLQGPKAVCGSKAVCEEISTQKIFCWMVAMHMGYRYVILSTPRHNALSLSALFSVGLFKQESKQRGEFQRSCFLEGVHFTGYRAMPQVVLQGAASFEMCYTGECQPLYHSISPRSVLGAFQGKWCSWRVSKEVRAEEMSTFDNSMFILGSN
ncbi:hypothetical protein U9M48_006757 [Paspalum notatum var. saurae]|uniref:Uncharacterized protein n=1 Tax=Paspalum notatum var. saurae TaxID=547442 RepID=A0AAQ3PPU2_PASNO